MKDYDKALVRMTEPLHQISTIIQEHAENYADEFKLVNSVYEYLAAAFDLEGK